MIRHFERQQRRTVGATDAGDRLALFPSAYRTKIAALIADAPRLADLAETFPGLLFALATEFGEEEQRTLAMVMIRNGAPLRHASGLIGLPWWLRRLPASCYTDPLPTIATSSQFGLRIANLVPCDEQEAPAWFRRIMFALEVVGEPYALWIARQRRMPHGLISEIGETLVAAWAWHGLNPHAPASSLLRTPWSEAISLRRALEEARGWSKRIDLAVAIGTGISDTWFPAGAAQGYQFIPLRRLEDYLSEAATMGNCLDQMGDQVRIGRTRVFSIRKGARPVADVEIGVHDDDCCVPRIVQLRGPRNRRAGPEIWQATFKWLATQEYRPLPRPDETADRMSRQQLIRAIWRPILSAGRSPAVEARLMAVAFGKEVSPSYRTFQAQSAAISIEQDGTGWRTNRTGAEPEN